MKRLLLVLLLIAPICGFSQKGKKEKLTPEQAAQKYADEIKQQQGFDSLHILTYPGAGKEEYPELTKQFNINVTTAAGSVDKFPRYCAEIQDTLIAIGKRYVCLLLDTASYRFQDMLKKGKYTETKTVFILTYNKGGQSKIQNIISDVYAPGRPW